MSTQRESVCCYDIEIKSLTEDFYLEMRPSCIQMLQCLFYRNVKSVSTDIKARVYTRLEKHVTGDSRRLWLSNNAQTIHLALLNPSMFITNV